MKIKNLVKKCGFEALVFYIMSMIFGKKRSPFSKIAHSKGPATIPDSSFLHQKDNMMVAVNVSLMNLLLYIQQRVITNQENWETVLYKFYSFISACLYISI